MEPDPSDSPELIELAVPRRLDAEAGRRPSPARTFATGTIVGAVAAAWLLVAIGFRPPAAASSSRSADPPSPAVAQATHPSPSPVHGPSPSPRATPGPTPTPTPAPCVTQTVRATFGAAMPATTTPPFTVPAGVLAAGAYVTQPEDGSRSPVDVWFLRAGSATRIASFAGNQYTDGRIDDISADGTVVLVQVGEEHITMPL